LGRGESVLRIRIYVDFGWLDADMIRVLDPVQKEQKTHKNKIKINEFHVFMFSFDG
jgi:hypothetical protein